MNRHTATLLVSCLDQRGLVAKIANFIYANGGNIIHADQHTDFAAGLFLTRIEWQLDGFHLPRELIGSAFNAIAQPLQADWKLHFSDTVPRIAIWVSRQNHCLFDLILRQQAKEFMAEIALIISNHLDLQVVAEQFGIKYYHMPINNENKPAQEAKQLKLLRQYNIDLVVLAKYMQILSSEFMAQFPKSSISITHFFQRLWGQTLTIKLMNGE